MEKRGRQMKKRGSQTELTFGDRVRWMNCGRSFRLGFCQYAEVGFDLLDSLLTCDR